MSLLYRPSDGIRRPKMHSAAPPSLYKPPQTLTLSPTTTPAPTPPRPPAPPSLPQLLLSPSAPPQVLLRAPRFGRGVRRRHAPRRRGQPGRGRRRRSGRPALAFTCGGSAGSPSSCSEQHALDGAAKGAAPGAAAAAAAVAASTLVAGGWAAASGCYLPVGRKWKQEPGFARPADLTIW
jgi:hypothetical protein